jgi:hypothetical protein
MNMFYRAPISTSIYVKMCVRDMRVRCKAIFISKNPRIFIIRVAG